MPEPSGTLFDALETKAESKAKARHRFGFAALLFIGGAMSVAVHAQQAGGAVQNAPSAQLAPSGQAAQSSQTAQVQKAQSSDSAQSIKATKSAKPSRRILLAQNAPPAGGVTPNDQTAADQNGGEQQLQEVVVTGSLIARPAAETAEAITVLNAGDLKNQGITNVEQALNTLTSGAPQINIASSVGTFSGGGTYANLRNLGEGRTLVLLDGQRMAPNAFSGDAVDLSGIPFSAIDSVEVLREGASSLYGSDAIGGVINFKTRQNFQGAQIEGNLDYPQRAGGASDQADFILGHGDLGSDGYNVMITGSYSHQDELQASQRAFSAEGFDPALGVTNTNFPGNWPAIVKDSNGNLYQSGYPACTGNTELTRYYGDCSYRYSAATDLLPASYEASGLVSFTKTLPTNNQVKLQYFYTQSAVTDWSGPMFYEFQMDPASPYFPTAGQLICDQGAANCTTPLNLSGVNNDPSSKKFGKAAPVNAIWSDPQNNRYNGNFNVAQRVLLTFSGSNGGWNYNADLNWSRNTNDDRNVAGYPNEDVLAPGGVLSDLINPFGPQSAAGQALINSSYVSGVYALGRDSRWSVDGQATHPLGTAFNAVMPATFAIGFDIGGEHFQYATTPYNDITAAATGLTDSSVAGSRLTQALYAELDVPMARSLDLDLSDRQDRYSDFGSTNNGKVKLRYQPVRFLTLRATASTGFRAPTLFDLYSSNYLAASSSGNMGQDNPYCATVPPTAPFTAATCATQGLALRGGNRNLTPETSENFDLGVILAPIQDMGITLDYYRILLRNTIGTIPTSAIYGNPATFAPYYVLDNNGGLTPTVAESSNCLPSYTLPTCGYIVRTNQNTGRITTDGIDASIQYLQHTGLGTFHEDLEGTLITQFLQQQYNGGPLLNLAGDLQIIELPPAYKWQHDLRVDWTSPMGMWGAGLSNRFYSSYVDEYTDGNGNPRIVGSYSLWDIYGSIRPIKPLTVLFGIKNLFDTSPPYTNASQNNFGAGYNILTIDPLLRNFYVNVKYTLF